MKTFNECLKEGFFGNLFKKSPPQDPKLPRTGDKITIYYLYKEKDNAIWLLSDVVQGTLKIEKDGSVYVQHERGVSKLANNIQQAKLEPDNKIGQRSWKINRHMNS